MAAHVQRRRPYRRPCWIHVGQHRGLQTVPRPLGVDLVQPQAVPLLRIGSQAGPAGERPRTAASFRRARPGTRPAQRAPCGSSPLYLSEGCGEQRAGEVEQGCRLTRHVQAGHFAVE